MCDNTAALQYGISSRISKADPKLYLIFSKFLLQFTTGDDIIIEHDRYGRLVKRSRRRPLTAETARQIRPVGQAVKTPPSHGGNRGSIPLPAILKTSDLFRGFLLFRRNALAFFPWNCSFLRHGIFFFRSCGVPPAFALTAQGAGRLLFPYDYAGSRKSPAVL